MTQTKANVAKNTAVAAGAAVIATGASTEVVEAQDLDVFVGLSSVSFSGTSDYAGPEPYSGTAPGNGFFAGADLDLGQFSVGLEVAQNNGTVSTDSYGSYGASNVLDLKLRVGTTIGRAFVYGIVGASTADVDTGYYSASDPGKFAGRSIGLGAQYDIDDNWFVGAEVLVRELEGDGGFGKFDFDNMRLTTTSLRVGFTF